MRMRGAGQLIDLLAGKPSDKRVQVRVDIRCYGLKGRYMVREFCKLLGQQGVIYTRDRQGAWWHKRVMYQLLVSGTCSQLQTAAHLWELRNAK